MANVWGRCCSRMCRFAFLKEVGVVGCSSFLRFSWCGGGSLTFFVFFFLSFLLCSTPTTTSWWATTSSSLATAGASARVPTRSTCRSPTRTVRPHKSLDTTAPSTRVPALTTTRGTSRPTGPRASASATITCRSATGAWAPRMRRTCPWPTRAVRRRKFSAP